MAGQNSLGEHLEDAYRFDSQTQIWEQIADFPGGPRGYAYGVSNNTMAYVGFGSNSSESGTIYPTDWWAYDILNNEWNQLSDFPSAGRRHPALVIVNDKIYVGLGSNTSNLGDWWEYDILNDVWSQKADLILVIDIIHIIFQLIIMLMLDLVTAVLLVLVVIHFKFIYLQRFLNIILKQMIVG